METSPAIRDLLAIQAPVALGGSGGKDSSAPALAISSYLNDIGHTGPRLLMHADLGHVEWRESLTILVDLARYCVSQRKYKRARSLFKRALSICEQKFEPGHQITVKILQGYFSFLQTTNQKEKAAKLELRIKDM